MSVGIKDRNAREDLNAYPNPFNNEVNVSLDNFEGQVNIRIVDMTGRVVFIATESGSKARLSLSNLVNGAYSMIIRDENGRTATGRLIKH